MRKNHVMTYSYANKPNKIQPRPKPTNKYYLLYINKEIARKKIFVLQKGD
jgi:hypothetical protein